MVNDSMTVNVLVSVAVAVIVLLAVSLPYSIYSFFKNVVDLT